MKAVGLPSGGETVVIIDMDGREHRSAVEAEADQHRMTLLRPTNLGMGVPLLIGDAMTVTWNAGDNMVGMVRARLAGMRRVDESAVWDAELTSEPWQIERRAHVRVDVSGTIAMTECLEPHSLKSPRIAEGELVDVSEAAVRYSVDEREIWLSRRNCRVRLEFQLGEQTIQVYGRVVAGNLARRDETLRDVVVMFDRPFAGQEALQAYLSAAEDLRAAGAQRAL